MKKLFFLFALITAFALSLSAQSKTANISYISYKPYKDKGVKGLLIEKWSDGTEVKINRSTNMQLIEDEHYMKEFFGEDGSIYILDFKSCLETEYLASIEKFNPYMSSLYRQVCQYQPKIIAFKSEIDSSIIKIDLSPLVLKNYQCQESKADGSAYWETGDESPYDIETTNGKIVAIRDTRTDIWYNRLD